jgi:hypothetical protein
VPPSRQSGPKHTSVGTFKHLDVGPPLPLASLVAALKPRTLSAREIAVQERDEEMMKAVNQAAVGPESFAIPIKLRPDQKSATTLRSAFLRVIKATNAPVKIGLRGDTIYLSRGAIPGRRGRRTGE